MSITVITPNMKSPSGIAEDNFENGTGWRIDEDGNLLVLGRSDVNGAEKPVIAVFSRWESAHKVNTPPKSTGRTDEQKALDSLLTTDRQAIIATLEQVKKSLDLLSELARKH